MILYFLAASILQIWQKVESGSINFDNYLYHLQVRFTKLKSLKVVVGVVLLGYIV